MCHLPVKLLLQELDILQIDEIGVGHRQQLGGHRTVFSSQGLVGQAQEVVNPDGRHLLGFESVGALQKLEADASVVHKSDPGPEIVLGVRFDRRKAFEAFVAGNEVPDLGQTLQREERPLAAGQGVFVAGNPVGQAVGEGLVTPETCSYLK